MKLIKYSIHPVMEGQVIIPEPRSYNYHLLIPAECGGLTQDQMKALLCIIAELKLDEVPDTMGIEMRALKMEEGDGK